MPSNGHNVGLVAIEQCKMVHPDGTVIKLDARVFEAYREFIEQRKQGSLEIAFISGGVRQVIAKTVYQ